MRSTRPNRGRILAGGIFAAVGIERTINAYLLTGWAHLSLPLILGLAFVSAGLLVFIPVRFGGDRR